ncbi:MAG: LacI family transcriptional regulator [Lentisphaeria bacterium]|nr:LacI family transcriptional regulator [Lentisphaeria bacterium]
MKNKSSETKTPQKKRNICVIAKLAGVSPATVSRALNNHPYVTKEVHDRIFDAVHQLGYQPRTPSDKKRLAIIINDRSGAPLNSYDSSMLYHLTCQCDRNGITTEIFTYSNMELLEENFLSVAITFQQLLTEQDLKRYSYTRFITINDQVPGGFSVHSDERQGIQLALEHLRESGHRRIALLLPNLGDNCSVARRRQAFLDFSAEAGFQDAESLVTCLEQNPVEAIAKLMRTRKPDALLIAGEDMLFQTNYAVNMLGLNVPDDLSIISYENYYASACMTPPHTTVAQNFEQLAALAVQRALDVFAEQDVAENSEVVLPNTLILRDSVKKRFYGNRRI